VEPAWREKPIAWPSDDMAGGLAVEMTPPVEGTKVVSILGEGALA